MRCKTIKMPHNGQTAIHNETYRAKDKPFKAALQSLLVMASFCKRNGNR